MLSVPGRPKPSAATGVDKGYAGRETVDGFSLYSGTVAQHGEGQAETVKDLTQVCDLAEGDDLFALFF